MELKKLYEMQSELDQYIVDKAINKDFAIKISGNDKEFLNDRILALFTEVAEFANATKCFKYWSNKPSESEARVREEYVDILHFFLSIGNTMGFTPEEVENAYIYKWNENFRRQEEGY